VRLVKNSHHSSRLELALHPAHQSVSATSKQTLTKRMQMMRTFLWHLCGVVCVTMGCSTPAQPESYAVGTRLGGGSLLFGADSCTDTAAPSVPCASLPMGAHGQFLGHSTLPHHRQPGKRLALAGRVRSDFRHERHSRCRPRPAKRLPSRN